MDVCKLAMTPSLSDVKLETNSSSPPIDCTSYRPLVGSLIYLTHTCLNISYFMGIVSIFMQEPHELH